MKPRLRKTEPGHYDVMDPLDPKRLIGRVRKYRQTNTSRGSRYVENGWIAELADGSEPELYTAYETRNEALTAIMKSVYP